MSQTIVIARVESEVVVARERRTDLGEHPVFKTVSVAKAAIWLNVGTDADVAKAHAYAAREGYQVFRYPTTEPDPLGRARRDALTQCQRPE